MLKKILPRKRKTEKWDELMVEIKRAKQDPQFRKEIRKFIKITTGTYKLKDYGLERL